jgi:hypothetical protein
MAAWKSGSASNAGPEEYPMATPPLFILTCMRSYSSLVSTMLGQHPELYGLPELNPFIADTLAGILRKLRIVRPQSLHGLLRAVAQIEFGEQSVACIEQARDWLHRHGHWTARDLFAHLSVHLEPRILIDKSPSTPLNPVHLQRLRHAFPEARILHLVRHPRATCQSIHQLRQKSNRAQPDTVPGGAEPSPEQLWLRINRTIVAFTATLPPSQSMRIQGEQLLSEPELYLGQIAEWLGLSNAPACIAAMLHPEDSPYACIGPPNALFGNDPNFLRNPHYARRPIPPQRLDGALDWPGDAPGGFSADTRALAHQFGYR